MQIYIIGILPSTCTQLSIIRCNEKYLNNLVVEKHDCVYLQNQRESPAII